MTKDNLQRLEKGVFLDSTSRGGFYIWAALEDPNGLLS